MADFSILLIDDGLYEADFVQRLAALASSRDVVVSQESSVRRAVGRLCQDPYDLILLDTNLIQDLGCCTTIELLNYARKATPLSLVSAEPASLFSHCPKLLGCDYLIDMADLGRFLRSQVNGTSDGSTCCGCNDPNCCGLNAAA